MFDNFHCLPIFPLDSRFPRSRVCVCVVVVVVWGGGGGVGVDPLPAIGNMMEIKCGQNFFHGKWVVAKHGFSIEGWKMKVFMENVLSKCALRARALWSFFRFPKITCTAVQPLFLEFWKII